MCKTKILKKMSWLILVWAQKQIHLKLAKQGHCFFLRSFSDTLLSYCFSKVHDKCTLDDKMARPPLSARNWGEHLNFTIACEQHFPVNFLHQTTQRLRLLNFLSQNRSKVSNRCLATAPSLLQAFSQPWGSNSSKFLGKTGYQKFMKSLLWWADWLY